LLVYGLIAKAVDLSVWLQMKAIPVEAIKKPVAFQQLVTGGKVSVNDCFFKNLFQNVNLKPSLFIGFSVNEQT
jgi:hypothetical protein